MVFKQGNRSEELNIYFNGKRLNVVTKFSYLGVILSCNGSFYQAQKVVSEQDSRALFSLFFLFDKIEFNIRDKLKLFDSMINPIFNYGSEIWGFHKSPDIEKVHVRILKGVLSLNRNVTSAWLYGRFPLSVLRKIRIIKYWFKICIQTGSLMPKFLM